MRHASQVVEQIFSLRKKGHTLDEIVLNTGLPKTTVYYHIRKVPVPSRVTRRKAVHRKRFSKIYSGSMKGRSFKNYSFNKPRQWDEGFVLLVAHFMFDGSVKKTSAVYYNRSKVLVSRVLNGMAKYLQVDDYKLKNDENGVYVLSYHNVEIANFLKGKIYELLKIINTKNTNIECKRSFLKAFFDDEGNVYYKGLTRKVRGYQHDHELLLLIQRLLQEFSIESSIENKNREIVITGKNNILNFRNQVGFSKGVRVNGRRKNSVWKESLEKSHILDMAINSYKK